MPINLDNGLSYEIRVLSKKHDIPPEILEYFAKSVIAHVKPPKELTINQLKKAVFKFFDVKSTDNLKKSEGFQMATDGMGKFHFAKKETWKKLYREFIGVLPNEEYEIGYGCINGINIFKYHLPWRVFDLNPEMASVEDVKSAYRYLSKIYHPDIPQTGDSDIFDRINDFYQTLTAMP